MSSGVGAVGLAEWRARDLLFHLAARNNVYDTIFRMTEFEEMPDMFGYGQDLVSHQEAAVRMTRNSFDEGGPAMARRSGTFNLSEPEWEYRAAVPLAGKSTDELLHEFREVHEDLIARVQNMPDGLLEKPSPVGDSGDALADTLKRRSGDARENFASRVDAALAGA